jgi:hypothetical protein
MKTNQSFSQMIGTECLCGIMATANPEEWRFYLAKILKVKLVLTIAGKMLTGEFSLLPLLLKTVEIIDVQTFMPQILEGFAKHFIRMYVLALTLIETFHT